MERLKQKITDMIRLDSRSHAALARELDCSRSLICMIRHGQSKVGGRTLSRAMELYGITINL